MKATIRIQLDNKAQYDHKKELARILREIANATENFGIYSYAVGDRNGQNAGGITVTGVKKPAA